MPLLNSGLPTAMPPDAISLEGQAVPTAMPSDAMPLEQQQAAPTMPPDAIPLEMPSDAAPVETGSTFSDLLKSVTGAMFGNQVDQATPLGPVIMNDAGEFYKGQDGKTYAFSKTDFIAPDPKTGTLMAFARNPSEGVLGKVRDVASAVVPGLAVTAPEGSFVRAARAGAEAAGVNEAATPAAMPADAIPLESAGAPAAAETAPADTIAPAAETAASGAATGSEDLQAKINGLWAGDKQIATPEELSLLAQKAPEETAGSGARTPDELTRPILTPEVHGKVLDAIDTMLQAGKVQLAPGIQKTDQVLALMRNNVLPPETFRAILSEHGVSPDELSQALLGGSMREAARVGGQTLQKLSAFAKVLENAVGPEADAVAAGLRDDIGNKLFGTMAQVRGIANRSIVATLGNAIRNAVTAPALAGIDSLARVFEGGLRAVVGAPDSDPIRVFGNWVSMFQPGRASRIAKTLTSVFPDVKAQLYGVYSSDISKATGGGFLGKAEKVLDAANFANRFQEFFFRDAFLVAELDRRLAGRGLSLDQLVDSVRLSEIHPAEFEAGIKEALRLTYGTPLGHGAFDQMVRGFNMVQTAGGKNPFPPFPFVRFLSAGSKWLFEHSPVGPIRLLSRSERAALGPKGNLQVASRAMAGSAMLYGAYMLRHSDLAGPNWYQLRIPGTGHYLDVRPLIPVTAFMFAGDVIKRFMEDTLTGTDARQMLEGTIGANFRAGSGLLLVDHIINAANEGESWTKVKELLKESAGEDLARFVQPFQTLKDFLAQAGSAIDALDIGPVKGDNSTLSSFFGQIKSLSDQERIVRDTRQSPILGPTMSKIPYVSTFLPPLASPTRSGPVVQAVPAARQLGLPVSSDMTPVEAELGRLNIQRREILPSSGDPAYDRALATVMGPLVDKAVGNLIKSPGYQKMDNPAKALTITDVISSIRASAAKALPGDMQAQQQFARKGVRYRVFFQDFLKNLPPEKRDLITKLLIR